MPKTASINIRVEPAIKAAADKAAADDRRSLASLVEKLLVDYLHGHGPDPFRGAFKDGAPRDPSHDWYKVMPMEPDRLEATLTNLLRERGITEYRVVLKKVPKSKR